MKPNRKGFQSVRKWFEHFEKVLLGSVNRVVHNEFKQENLTWEIYRIPSFDVFKCALSFSWRSWIDGACNYYVILKPMFRTSPGKRKSAFEKHQSWEFYISLKLNFPVWIRYARQDWLNQGALSQNVQFICEHSGNSLGLVSKDFAAQVFV